MARSSFFKSPCKSRSSSFKSRTSNPSQRNNLPKNAFITINLLKNTKIIRYAVRRENSITRKKSMSSPPLPLFLQIFIKRLPIYAFNVDNIRSITENSARVFLIYIYIMGEKVRKSEKEKRKGSGREAKKKRKSGVKKIF